MLAVLCGSECALAFTLGSVACLYSQVLFIDKLYHLLIGPRARDVMRAMQFPDSAAPRNAYIVGNGYKI